MFTYQQKLGYLEVVYVCAWYPKLAELGVPETNKLLPQPFDDPCLLPRVSHTTIRNETRDILSALMHPLLPPRSTPSEVPLYPFHLLQRQFHFLNETVRSREGLRPLHPQSYHESIRTGQYRKVG
jgi:hypothetical protein